MKKKDFLIGAGAGLGIGVLLGKAKFFAKIVFGIMTIMVVINITGMKSMVTDHSSKLAGMRIESKYNDKIEIVEREYIDKIVALEHEYSMKLDILEEKVDSKIEDYKNKLISANKTIELGNRELIKHKDMVGKNRETIKSLESKNKTLSSRNRTLEANNKKYKAEIESLEKELRKARLLIRL